MHKYCIAEGWGGGGGGGHTYPVVHFQITFCYISSDSLEVFFFQRFCMLH